MQNEFTPVYFDRMVRLGKMNIEFDTLLADVHVKVDTYAKSIVLELGYGVWEKRNLLDIIHKYDFDIKNIIFSKPTNNPDYVLDGKSLLITLEDLKDHTDLLKDFYGTSYELVKHDTGI